MITGEDYRATATTPVYDLVLAVRKRRMRYLGYVLRLPPGMIVRRSFIALVKGGLGYPEYSLFSDCEVDGLHETDGDSDEPIRLARQSGVADEITIADDL